MLPYRTIIELPSSYTVEWEEGILIIGSSKPLKITTNNTEEPTEEKFVDKPILPILRTSPDYNRLSDKEIKEIRFLNGQGYSIEELAYAYHNPHRGKVSDEDVAYVTELVNTSGDRISDELNSSEKELLLTTIDNYRARFNFEVYKKGRK
jgi:hypothetical protein